MTYGITPQGFVKKPFSVLMDEIKQDIIAIDSTAVIEPETVYGNLQATMADREYALWNLFELMYSQRNVYGAVGSGLDDLIALNNMKRYSATYSYIFGFKVVGQPGLVIPAGFTVASTVNPDIKFVTTQDYTIGPDFGTYAPNAYGDVLMQLRSTVKGKIVALAGTVTTMETPKFGIAFVEHTNDAASGRNRETDVEVLERREKSLTTTRGATVNGIIRAISDLNEDDTKVPLTYVDVISNSDSVTDQRGRPPHTVECIVEQQGNTNSRDQEIAQIIFDSKGAGTNTYGELGPFITTDYKGREYEVFFSRPALIPIYVIVNLSVAADLSSAEITSIKEDIVVAGNELGVGTDVSVIGPNGLASALKNSKIITGDMKIGTTDPASLTYVDIDNGLTGPPEKSSFSTARITINVVVA